jgi:hypothetical protein
MALGWKPMTSLKAGVEQAHKDFLSRYASDVQPAIGR